MENAIIFGVIILVIVIISSIVSYIDKVKKECDSQIQYYKSRESGIKMAEERTSEKEKQAQEMIDKAEEYSANMIVQIDEYIKEKCTAYNHLSSAMADLLVLHYEKSANELVYKRRPAIKEAQRIKDLARETKVIIKEKKVLEYKLGYIETLFPNILDIFDDDFNEAEAFELETDNTTDRVRTFLSHDEYTSLSVTERNQLALDRYIQNRKSKWQIGRDYEMYIGQGFEARGFSVEYTGIIENLEDMGRDLIASKGNKMYIVQCKNWSQEKTIHEKHIFQLYGTVVLKTLETPGAKIRAIFVTSTTLSDKAREIAKHLNIWVYQNTQLKEFPRIKCNINKSTKEKIYHLPFDQQYDKTTINLEEGEKYAFTVAEAEQLGFRRAWRHSFSE